MYVYFFRYWQNGVHFISALRKHDLIKCRYINRCILVHNLLRTNDDKKRRWGRRLSLLWWIDVYRLTCESGLAYSLGHLFASALCLSHVLHLNVVWESSMTFSLVITTHSWHLAKKICYVFCSWYHCIITVIDWTVIGGLLAVADKW